MENKNYEYNGWSANGFVALALVLLGMAASVALIIYGANQEAPAGRMDRDGGSVAAALFLYRLQGSCCWSPTRRAC